METDYDVIIIGCGPAGLAAGLYAGRARLKVLLLGDETAGGPIRRFELVENYPGFPDGISGAKLGLEMMKQAMKYGIDFKLGEVEKIELQGDHKVVKANLIGGGGEATYLAKTIIVAGGAHRRKLGVPGEDKFTGKGVSYCGVCDGPLFKDRQIAVVGGGDGALTEVLYLSKIASKVIVIHRRTKLRATPVLQEKAFSESKIEFLWNTIVEGIEGEDSVRKLKLRQVSTGQQTTLEAAGVFVSIGLDPNTGYLTDLLSLDPQGYIEINEELETSIPGIFAAGDIRQGSARQIATAVGDGVTAALSAERLIALS